MPSFGLPSIPSGPLTFHTADALSEALRELMRRTNLSGTPPLEIDQSSAGQHFRASIREGRIVRVADPSPGTFGAADGAPYFDAWIQRRNRGQWADAYNVWLMEANSFMLADGLYKAKPVAYEQGRELWATACCGALQPSTGTSTGTGTGTGTSTGTGIGGTCPCANCPDGLPCTLHATISNTGGSGAAFLNGAILTLQFFPGPGYWYGKVGNSDTDQIQIIMRCSSSGPPVLDLLVGFCAPPTIVPATSFVCSPPFIVWSSVPIFWPASAGCPSNGTCTVTITA